MDSSWKNNSKNKTFHSYVDFSSNTKDGDFLQLSMAYQQLVTFQTDTPMISFMVFGQLTFYRINAFEKLL